MLLTLDLKTVAFMLVIFSSVFALLVAFAKANAQKVSGAGYWALGGLLVSIGVLVRILLMDGSSKIALGWMIGNLFIIAGLSLNFLGVQKFNNERPFFWLPLISFAALVLSEVTSYLFAIPAVFIILLSPVMFSIIDGLVGYKLLTLKLREGYWHYFNGAIFLIVAMLVMLKIGFKSVELSLLNIEDIHQHGFDKIDMFWAFIGLSLKQILTLLGFSQMMNNKRLQALHEQAMVDHLTQAYNRRGLVDAAEGMAANCIRAGFQLSMILLDLDHFKRVNDTFGHDVGDKVIKAFADTVHFEIRAGDLFGRYGGEEFCLLLPNTNEYDAMSLANRIRESFASMEMRLNDNAEHFSVSAGVSCSEKVGYDFKGLLAAADSALYAAKEQGRNRVVTHTSVSRHLD